MDTHSKSVKPIKEKFTQGCVYVFKKWSAFRLALDNNPRILTYYNEDQSVLEINEMLSTLYDEIFNTLNCGKLAGTMLEDELSDCLYGFMNDYFNIVLEDQSETEVAQVLIQLYNELKKGKDNLYISLENYKNPNTKYSIDFPILGNQKIIFEKNDDEEEEEEDMDDMDNKNRNNNGNGNEEDDDGFVEVKKGKGF